MKASFSCLILILGLVFQLQGQDLNFYIEQARNNSPLIKDLKNQSEASRLEAERLRSYYTKAQINLSGGYLVAPIISDDTGQSNFILNPSGNETDYFGYDLATSNGGLYQGVVNLSQPLFNGSRYQTNAELNLLEVRKNENEILLTIHDLEKFVTDQYIICLRDYRQADYLKSLILIIKDQMDITTKLAESGLSRQSDYSLLVIEQKTQEAALNTYNAAYKKDLMDLRILCGITDTSYQVLESLDLQLTEDIESSRFVEKYLLDSLNLIASKNVFELKYKPEVGFFANAGLNAVYAPTLFNRFGLSAGLNFSMNISDGRQRSISAQKTEVLLQSTSLYKNFFYDQNRVRKSSVLDELKSVEERISLTQDQLNEYQNLFELYKKELFVDNEVKDQTCSFKSTSHNGSMIASIITSVLANHITNKKAGKKYRSVPFKIDYQLPPFMFNANE